MSCQTCQVHLNGVDIKKHLHSEWHIYNLRRSFAGLQPLSEELFLKKEEQFRLLNKTNISEDSSRQKFYCEMCKKCFKSNNAYVCHVASQQHLKKKKETIPEITEENFQSQPDSGNECSPGGFSPSDFRKPLPIGTCFFCDTSYEGNPDAVTCVLSHMTKKHNFTLPYFDKLVDTRGLLADLGRLVGEEFACLGCGRQFLGRREDRNKRSSTQLRKKALSALRRHMLDKGHNFLYTGIEDPVIVSMAVNETADVDKLTVPPIACVGGELYSQYYNGDLANKTLVLPGPDNKFAEEETFEVRLPSGGTMGHRRYFQTVFRQNPCTHLRSVSKGSVGLSWKAHPRSKALLGLSDNEIVRVAIKENRDRRVEMNRRSQEYLKLGIRGNTVLAKHYRTGR